MAKFKTRKQIKVKQVILNHPTISDYFKYKKKGYTTIWEGENKIAMIKPIKQYPKNPFPWLSRKEAKKKMKELKEWNDWQIKELSSKPMV